MASLLRQGKQSDQQKKAHRLVAEVSLLYSAYTSLSLLLCHSPCRRLVSDSTNSTENCTNGPREFHKNSTTVPPEFNESTRRISREFRENPTRIQRWLERRKSTTEERRARYTGERVGGRPRRSSRQWRRRRRCGAARGVVN
ncbi:PREDICTED: uncharacterized protein LOC108551605 isoform X1 [Eufriesea mexicana]|uniref:uncharacterized protein LOC108551605 isoform X1 n=1 Tax=Eufriesea mexicana TaxID=516756 RepID=UPI00083C2C4E|nr:PREDICTED: uncharacterized protein LOC108551605 isoform X1 [Eufriesea mexicana]